MARYTGAACHVCRRQGAKLFLKGERCLGSKCALDRRPSTPARQGFRRRRLSDYGTQLKEKQKARAVYGVLERQFRRYFGEARKRPGMSGQNLLQMLEMRLDNVVYRLGLAVSRRQARQLVRHGHFLLNGRPTDIPSAMVRPGDTVKVRPASVDSECFQVIREGLTKRSVPRWLEIDTEAVAGRVLSVPTREDIDTGVNEQLIVGYYSR